MFHHLIISETKYIKIIHNKYIQKAIRKQNKIAYLENYANID